MAKLKDFSTIVFGQFVDGCILLASTRVITTLLSPSEMGRFSIMYAVMALFSAVFISSVGAYFQRRLVEWNLAKKASYYVGRYIGYLFFLSVVLSIFMLVLKNVCHVEINVSNLWIFVLTFGLVFFVNVNVSFYSNLNLFQKRLWFICCSNLTLMLSLLISSVLVLVFSKTAEYWILGQIFANTLVIFLGGMFFYRVVAKRKNDKADRDLGEPNVLSDIVQFAWPLSVASLILWGHSYAYQFAVEMIHGIAFVGFFSVGFNLGTKFIAKFESVFLNFYDPIFYSDIANGNDQQKAEAWNKYARAFVPSLILLTGFICIGRHLLANIFFSPEFQGISDGAIFWGSITAVLSCIRSAYVKVGIASLRMRGLIIPYSFGVVVMAALLFLLSNMDPFLGTGLALVSGALAMLLYLMYEMHKLLPVHFPARRIGHAVLYLIPLWFIFMSFRSIFPEPSIVESIVILISAGAYVFFAELMLNKEWLENSDHFLVKKFYRLCLFSKKVDG